MNSDDLAKNLAQMYVSKASPVKDKGGGESSGNFNAQPEDSLYVYPGLANSDENDEDLLSQSFDINFTQEAPFFRFRTNTSAKLEKLSEMRKKKAQTKVVKVDDTVVKLNQEAGDDDELFIRKELNEETLAPKASKLTLLLETLPPIKLNKYREYSTLEGSSYAVHETKSIQVKEKFNTRNLGN